MQEQIHGGWIDHVEDPEDSKANDPAFVYELLAVLQVLAGTQLNSVENLGSIPGEAIVSMRRHKRSKPLEGSQ